MPVIERPNFCNQSQRLMRTQHSIIIEFGTKAASFKLSLCVECLCVARQCYLQLPSKRALVSLVMARWNLGGNLVRNLQASRQPSRQWP